MLDFVQILSNFCNFEFELVPFPDEHKTIDIGDYYADYGKFQSITGWEPKIDLSEGLKLTVDYFKENRDKYK